MPLDATTYEPAARSRSGVHLRELRLLAKALREPMRADWCWNFKFIASPLPCGTAGCALGLAAHLGIISDPGSTVEFGLASRDRERLFLSVAAYGAPDRGSVTPLMVATAIDTIIAREEAADAS